MLLTPECEVQFIHVLVSVRITVAVHTCMSELRSMCKQNTVHWCVCVYTSSHIHQCGCNDIDRQHSFFTANVVTKLPRKPCCSLWEKKSMKENSIFQPSQPLSNILTKGEKLTVIFHYINK